MTKINSSCIYINIYIFCITHQENWRLFRTIAAWLNLMTELLRIKTKKFNPYSLKHIYSISILMILNYHSWNGNYICAIIFITWCKINGHNSLYLHHLQSYGSDVIVDQMFLLMSLYIYIIYFHSLSALSGLLQQGCRLHEIQHGRHCRSSLWYLFLPGMLF